MNNLLEQSEIQFKLHDKVQVMVNKTPDKPFALWKAEWDGVITSIGTHFAGVTDFKKTDSNVGTISESEQFVPYNSKMLKIIKE